MVKASGNRPALLLDRDGVINREERIRSQDRGLRLYGRNVDLCGSAMAAGMAIVVVTNQAGVGRG